MPRERFLELLKQEAFIEHAEFSGNFYGTSFMAVNQIHETGRRCILDIEVQVRFPFNLLRDKLKLCLLQGDPSS